MVNYVQRNSGGKYNILGGHNIYPGEKKIVYMSMCPILNGYCERALGISISNSIRFLSVGLDEFTK